MNRMCINILVFVTWQLVAGVSVAQEVPQTSTTPTSQMSQEEQAHFKTIAGKLRCPTCTGLSVLDSDAPFSMQIQSVVKEKIKQGESEDKILKFFQERYGPWILREPPKEGIDLFAWLFPLALMTFGPLAVWFFVWRKRKTFTAANLKSTESIVSEFERALDQSRQRAGA